MWCERCRREYEPFRNAESGRAACPECGETGSTACDAPDGSDNDPIRLFEDLQDDVLVGAGRSAPLGAKPEVLRIDAAHPLTFVPVGTAPPDETSESIRATPGRSSRNTAAGFLGAVFGYLGVVGLALGAGLLWYGHVENLPELEQPGWLTVMVGQIGLLFGWATLVWSGSRTAEPEVGRQLTYLHERLSALESDSTMVNPVAHSFYHHLAAGAPAHLLLVELKGQLDLLATRLGHQHRNQS